MRRNRQGREGSLGGSDPKHAFGSASRSLGCGGRLRSGPFPCEWLFGGLLVFLVAFACWPGTGLADRIKDLTSVGSVRSNQLVGYGLVVGLDGTGDRTTQTPFTVQSLRSFLASLGVNIPAGTRLQVDNVAAVSVHSVLPAFAKSGQSIDVTVSSIGNAESLRGGSLLMTPMRGVDGQVYAVAQGNVVVGGLGVTGAGSRVTVNVPSAGRIPGGAVVEREPPDTFLRDRWISLRLREPDFTTASRIAGAIDSSFGAGTASTRDASTVRVRAPASRHGRVSFIAAIENLEVEPGEAAAKVIVNSRTGTVVISRGVRVSPVAVTHGSLSVTVTSDPLVSQPAPFSRGGETVVVPRSDIAVQEEINPMFLFEPGVALSDIVDAVNRVGASPSDLVAILEAIRAAGALRAELIVI